MLALLVLFLASVAAALVAVDIGISHRALLDERDRAHERQLLDGAMADALARRAAADSYHGGELSFPAGTTRSEVERIDSNRLRIQVEATVRGRRAAAAATAETTGSGTLRVLSWARVAPD